MKEKPADLAVQKLIEALRTTGWSIVTGGNDTSAGVPALHQRMPDDYESFLSSVTLCVNAAETAWFLCAKDYNGQRDTAFRWNDFEMQSLEAAGGDASWKTEITTFWSKTLPIFLSVKSGYAYLALNVDPGSDRYGSVVYGREPEYEDVTHICDSFSDLCDLVATLVLHGGHHPVLSGMLL
jgi:hypothetical protein